MLDPRSWSLDPEFLYFWTDDCGLRTDADVSKATFPVNPSKRVYQHKIINNRKDYWH